MTPTLRWSLATISASEGAAAEPHWMTPSEKKRLSRGVEKRRRQHRLGRLTAKRLVSDSHRELFGRPLELDSFEIDVEPSGAPCVRLPDTTAPPSLSISHSGNTAFCAVLWGGGIVGADVETVERRSEAFVRDFFAPLEILAWDWAPEERRDLLANVIWSAKEAVLKVLKLGLTVDTRHVVCAGPALDATRDGGWKAFTARFDTPLGMQPEIDELRGASCVTNGLVLTLAFRDQGDSTLSFATARQLEAAAFTPELVCSRG